MIRKENYEEGIRVLASVVIQRGKKILLINERAEPYNGLWVIPQGYVKLEETVGDAARREVLEELGVDVELEGIVGVYDDFVKEGPKPTHYVIVAFLGRIKGSQEPRPTTEAIDFAWVDVSKGLPNVPSVIQRILYDVAKGEGRRVRIKL
jgi:8-oxo-dGTP diphosphatase